MHLQREKVEQFWVRRFLARRTEIVRGANQTPAKQILKMYVIDTETGLPATWGKMFIRNVVIDGLLNSFTFGVFWLVSSIWIFTNPERQRLTDKIAKTIVVDAPNGL